MSGSETTYYDASTGTKLGSSQSNVNSYQMGGTTVTSTNKNYNGPNGEYLGDEWSDGTNSRWNMESVKPLSEEPAWLDLDGNGTAGETKSVTVLVQEGAGSRVGPNDQTETEAWTDYYTNDDNRTYLGGAQTRNGETTRFDANWNELGLSLIHI